MLICIIVWHLCDSIREYTTKYALHIFIARVHELIVILTKFSSWWLGKISSNFYWWYIVCTCVYICMDVQYVTLWHLRMPEPIRISLPTSLMNLVIGNGGSTFLCTLHFSLLHASFLHKLWCLNLNIFLDCCEVWYLRYANYPYHVSVIYILKFQYLENSASIFGKCLSRQLHSSTHDFTIVFIP